MNLCNSSLEWSKFQMELTELLDSLSFLPLVLIKEIVYYCAPIDWKDEMIHQWQFSNKFPYGITSDGKSLYVCSTYNHCIWRFDLLQTHELQDTWDSPLTSFSYPKGIDIFHDELYVLDMSQVHVFNYSKKLFLRKWKIASDGGGSSGISLKVSGKEIFLTVNNFHQIYVYNHVGTLLRKYGKSGSGPGEFKSPSGITVDDNFIYICDSDNHRIQVLDRDNGLYCHKWGGEYSSNNGQFRYPYAITLSVEERLLYVGDQFRIQVFTTDGKFVTRFAQTSLNVKQVSGLCVIAHYLCVSETEHSRIQVWS